MSLPTPGLPPAYRWRLFSGSLTPTVYTFSQWLSILSIHSRSDSKTIEILCIAKTMEVLSLCSLVTLYVLQSSLSPWFGDRNDNAYGVASMILSSTSRVVKATWQEVKTGMHDVERMVVMLRVNVGIPVTKKVKKKVSGTLPKILFGMFDLCNAMHKYILYCYGDLQTHCLWKQDDLSSKMG
jgi:hypothetical protein